MADMSPEEMAAYEAADRKRNAAIKRAYAKLEARLAKAKAIEDEIYTRFHP